LNVGGPASGGSAALRAVMEPLRAIDQGLHRAYRQAKAEHDRAARQAREAKTEIPPPPLCQTALLEDCALDVVVGHLARNPRGLLVARDEAEAWVLGLRGGRSAERRLWFSALGGHALRLDRKGDDGASATRLDGPFLAFCGNIAPELLPALGVWEAGVLDRVLVAFPDALPRAHWSDGGLSDEARRGWSEVVDRLRGRPLREEGAPEVVALADDARAEWVHWYNAQADALNAPGADGEAQAAEAMLCEYAARLALIVHLLDVACHPTRGAAEPLPSVSRSALVGGLRLASYFRAQHRRIRCEVDGGRGNRVTRAIVDWVRRTDRTRFSVSELTHSLRWIADWRGEPEAALRLLVGQNAIRRVQVKQGQSPKGGRPRSPLYEVHPGLKGT
ncbi:MAG: DUF3987 domain-containing protein, partial [Isosphaeraceae bacterium]|nr:DUF3987 domain-containing protein [Isosphaeraceae bacterium]